MRKVVLLLATGAFALILAPVAPAAVEMQVGITGKITPTKGGTVAKPSGKYPLFTEVTTRRKDGAGQGAPVRKTVLNYPAQFEFNGPRFKSCSKATLDARGPTACPAGSQVGAGSADALIGTQKVTLQVFAFNGPGGNKIELYVTPVLNSAIEGILKGGKGKRKTVTFQVPKNAIRVSQSAQGSTYASLTRFGANIGTYKNAAGKTVKAQAKLGGKTINFVETTGCTGGKLPISATFTFASQSEFSDLPENLRSTQPSMTAVNTIKCTT
jgi:hypothetical protein